MKATAKRFILAFCVVLCVATAGWCIDPFKANKGGFGPKIKGIQLGMKMSLVELVSRGVLRGKWPFYFGVCDKDSHKLFTIKCTGKEQELKEFEVIRAVGKFASFENKTGKLVDILAGIEKIGTEMAYISDYRDIWLINLNGDMRVQCMYFEDSDFGAEQMTPQEFAQAITDAYKIPSMDWDRQFNWWEYSNTSQGWGITCTKYRNVKVFPIVVESKFN